MSASASMLLVDRGLPTANLNNTAGVDRSNVAWTEGGYTPTDYWLVGDTFQNTSSQAWKIDSIRLWTMNPFSTVALWGGIGNSSISVVSSGVAISGANYADGSTYQGYSGPYRVMNQIDFAVNITLAPGQTYDFFLDGTGADYVVPFAHASNAALSGSQHDGSNDSMLEANVINGVIIPGSVGTWTSLGNGWDKASDVNVQVFGTPVPEPTTMIAGALLLLPFGVSTFRVLRKSRVA
jgi:hypothetical protein